MALPTSYLTTAKNLDGILTAIQGAQAPEKFTQAFLESLGFKSVADRLVIGVLKALGFIDDSGKPKDRYFNFLDQTQSAKILAEGIKDAYQDLFKVNIKAYNLSKAETINKLKTLGQGKLSDSVLDKMAMTFTALVKKADFQSTAPSATSHSADQISKTEEYPEKPLAHPPGIKLGGLVYNIQIVLPESRDAAVYDALFASLRRHLI
jgi:hypothetical protein